jgi:glycosyltransferase involved in cell wall biosynthesis
MSPFFTVATITYNSAPWVRETIESILSCTFGNFELIISDDCSTDETWQIIRDFDDSRIKASRNEKNIGEYQNRNKVLQQAQGKYIFYVDGDDIIYKDTLQNLYNYLQGFTDVGMIWGVPVDASSFAVLPYLLNPIQINQLMYLTTSQVSAIGLAETVFEVATLRQAGGFSTSYAIGDTFIKKKLALTCNVLLVPTGLSYWRRSKNQASQRASKKYRTFIDLYRIHQEVLSDKRLPLSNSEKHTARVNIRISQVKLVISNTLLKGRIGDFFTLMKALKVSIKDIPLLFKSGNYTHQMVDDVSKPLVNNYNFTASKIEADVI